MTTENKINLNLLRPSIGDKIGQHQQQQQQQQQQPPTKLLINHGKPNFTINRSQVKSKQQQQQRLLLKNEQTTINGGGFAKVTLKKPQLPTTTANTKFLLKKASNDLKIHKSDTKDEFLEKRKQIYEKIEKENSVEENGYTNKIENYNTTTTIPTSPREQQHSYVKKISEQYQNGRTLLLKSPPISPRPIQHQESQQPQQQEQQQHHHLKQQLNQEFLRTFENGHSQKIVESNGAVENGVNIHNKAVAVEQQQMHTSATEKPALPKKNFIITNGNGAPQSPPPPPPPPLPAAAAATSTSKFLTRDSPTKTITTNATLSPNTPKIPSSANGGANFEQRTIVSFSKDLASGPNKYPDLVKVVKPASSKTAAADATIDNSVLAKQNEVLQELTKLKFDIELKDDVVIKPVIRSS